MKVLAIVFMVAAALIFSWLLTGCGEAQSWAEIKRVWLMRFTKLQREDWNETV